MTHFCDNIEGGRSREDGGLPFSKGALTSQSRTLILKLDPTSCYNEEGKVPPALYIG